jgi:hypothetical protein
MYVCQWFKILWWNKYHLDIRRIKMGITENYVDAKGNTWGYWNIDNYVVKHNKIDPTQSYALSHVCGYKTQADYNQGKEPGIHGSITHTGENKPQAIAAVSTSNKEFAVAGDITGYVKPGYQMSVTGSTGNDGDYTISFASYSAPNTTLTVAENVPDATVDGNIQIGPSNFPLLDSNFDTKEIKSYAISTNYVGNINEISFDTAFGSSVAVDGNRVILHVKSGDTGTVPSGLTEDAIYWIGFVSNGVAKFYTKRSDAIMDTNPIDIGSNVTGTVQIQLAPNNPRACIYDVMALGSDTGTIRIGGGQTVDLSNGTPDA